MDYRLPISGVLLVLLSVPTVAVTVPIPPATMAVHSIIVRMEN